ncbi:MAG: ABC transporter ATP-binding protein [Methylobacteriaceae bacterium]|nr:ABC transporter ATP-binding protein [Methylobacteriaceae bacterium]
MAQLRIDGLTKRFGAVTALDAVDLDIPDGAFVAMLGPSGCGKTTLLRCLAGLERPTSGTIRLGEADITTLPPERRGLGMMFQSYALFPHMRIRENLRFPLKMRGRGDAAAQDAKIDEALRAIRMEGMGDRYPREISGGQQQRVALARAIIADPPLLLLDEPLSNLDAQLRKQMQIELIELHRRIGLTTILVTHDQEEALSLADLVVLMNAGRIEQIGAPRDIYRKPATAFAAAFLGGANLLDVVVENGLARAGDGTALGPLAAPDGPRRLVLRQEALALRDAPRPGEATLAARIVAVAFNGATSRVVVEAAGQRLELTVPAAAIEGRAAGATAQLCFILADAPLV